MDYKKHWRVTLIVLIIGLLAFGGAIVGLSASVPCQPVSGNDPNASDLATPEGCDVLKSYKVADEPPKNKTYTSGDFTVTISNMNGDTFDFVANQPVYYVFVKGGVITPGDPGGCLYSYMPDGTLSDTGLGALPGHGISHVTFYWCEPVIPDTGCLKVIKAWDDLDSGETYTGSISVEIRDSQGELAGTLTLEDDGNGVWEDELCGLPLGTYTFEEVSVPGWEPSYDPDDRKLVVEAGEEPATGAIGTITNTYIEEFGALEVKKSINRARSGDQDIEFTAEVEGPDGFFEEIKFSVTESKLLEDLAIGEYTIREINIPPGFRRVSPAEVKVNLTADNIDVVQVVTITNSRPRNGNGEDPTGSIRVKKEFVGDVQPGPADNAKTFTINITGPENYLNQSFSVNDSWYKSGLPLGTYTIEEVDVPDGYTLMSAAQDVTIERTSLHKEVIINNRIDEEEIRGSITVRKAFTGDVQPDEIDNAQIFIINVTGPRNFMNQEFSVNKPWSMSDLPLGTYTIEEVNVPAGYRLETSAQRVTLTESNPSAQAVISNSIETEEILLPPEDVELPPEEPPIIEIVEEPEVPELPRTGGMTTLMTGFGALLAGAGALLLQRKRKMQ